VSARSWSCWFGPERSHRTQPLVGTQTESRGQVVGRFQIGSWFPCRMRPFPAWAAAVTRQPFREGNRESSRDCLQRLFRFRWPRDGWCDALDLWGSCRRDARQCVWAQLHRSRTHNRFKVFSFDVAGLQQRLRRFGWPGTAAWCNVLRAVAARLMTLIWWQVAPDASQAARTPWGLTLGGARAAVQRNRAQGTL
jgi:hypothetical protein